MSVSDKVVRQTVTLPAHLARRVRSIAKKRRISANRVLVDLVEEGIEIRDNKEKVFHDLANRFRAATEPSEVERLGNELGRMLFGE